MIEKEYYRLDELQNRFGITVHDIHYLLERRLVNPYFHIENTKFIVESWNKSKFIGYVHLIYRGIVTIPESELAKLLHLKKITPLNYLLSKNGHFELVCTDYGYEPYEDFFTEWQPKYQDEKDRPFFTAKLSPFVSRIPFHSYLKAKREAIKLENLESTEGYIHLENFHTPELKLPAAFNTFKFSDICIQREQLVSVGIFKILEQTKNEYLIEQGPPASNRDSENDSQVMGVLNNKFEELLARILRENQTPSSKLIHKILCTECKLEEDTRQYDIENILLDVVDDVIVWHDIYSKKKQKRCSFRRLENQLSDVRKLI